MVDTTVKFRRTSIKALVRAADGKRRPKVPTYRFSGKTFKKSDPPGVPPS